MKQKLAALLWLAGSLSAQDFDILIRNCRLVKLKVSARNFSARLSLSVKVWKSERSICGGRLVLMFEKRVLCEAG